MSVPNTFSTATGVIPLSQLDSNFAYYDNAFQITGTVMAVNYTFRIKDFTDSTKIAEFVLSGITTATTRSYTLPNVTGALATTATLTQTFSGTTTFSGTFSTSGATATFGTSTAASTYGLGTGATIAAATKTINIGTNGVSTSTTNINYGSAVAGATSNHIYNGNIQLQSGVVVVDAPAPTAISTTATLTNADIQSGIINTTGTTYTVTMPLGTTLETLVPWTSVDLGYDFSVINTASGTITIAVNTNVTSLGTLTILTATSARFRIRRTAANTFILYRL
jgi:hypothetical protein